MISPVLWPAIAVGAHSMNSGPRRCARALAASRDRAVDRDHVLAVDLLGGRPKPARPCASPDPPPVTDAERRLDRVQVVLADGDQRQLPDRGEVDGLPGPAGVGAAVAEEADGDLPECRTAARARRPSRCRARRRRCRCCPTYPRSKSARCIVPPRPPPTPVALPYSSAITLAGGRPLASAWWWGRWVPATMSSGRQRAHDADGDGLLPDRRMDAAGNGARATTGRRRSPRIGG